MNTTPTPSIWNETYSTKHIPIQVCASPSIFVNMNPAGNDPLTSMTQSIRNKNKYAAKLKSQSDDPSLTWEDTYSDPTNCSPCQVNACPTPKITVNTANGGGVGPNDNIATTGTIMCGSLFVSTELDKTGIYLKPVNNTPTLSLITEKDGDTLSTCTLNTSSIILNNIDDNTGNIVTTVNISGVDGSISMNGYIQLGMNQDIVPTNKNMGYCVTSHTNKPKTVSDYINIPLDKISYTSSSGYDYNTIFSFITSLNNHGIIITYYNDDLSFDNPLKIEEDGTYSIQCSLSIQQNNSNNYTSEFPPTIEVMLGYYLNSTTTPISIIPSRMTLYSITNSTTGNIQYNYSSFVNMGHILSKAGIISAKGGVLIAYLYQFEEASPIPGPIIAPIFPKIDVNSGNGLYVNVIPNFIVTKLT